MAGIQVKNVGPALSSLVSGFNGVTLHRAVKRFPPRQLHTTDKALPHVLNLALNPSCPSQWPSCSTGLASTDCPGRRPERMAVRSTDSGTVRGARLAAQLPADSIGTVGRNGVDGEGDSDWETELLNPGPENNERVKRGRRGGRRGRDGGAAAASEKDESAAFGWALRARQRAIKASASGIREVPVLEFADDKKKARKKAASKKKAAAKREVTRGAVGGDGDRRGGHSEGTVVAVQGPVGEVDLGGISANQGAGWEQEEDMELSEEYTDMLKNQVQQLSQAAGFRNRFKDLGGLRAALGDERPSSGDSLLGTGVPGGRQGMGNQGASGGVATWADDDENEEATTPWRAAVAWDADGQSEVEEWSPAIGRPRSGAPPALSGQSRFRLSSPSKPEAGQLASAQLGLLATNDWSIDSEDSDEWEGNWGEVAGLSSEEEGSGEDEVVVRSFTRKAGEVAGLDADARAGFRVLEEGAGPALSRERILGQPLVPPGQQGAAEKTERVPRIRRLGGRHQVGGSRDGGDAGGSQSRGFLLNRRLVEASGLEAVLEVVACEMELEGVVGPGISAVNAATALHRIATHVEAGALTGSARLAVARRQPVARLVGAAVELLPQCEAQALANIAWALAKIGGTALYASEADRLAEALLGRMETLTAQHLANCASALATAQHAAPELLDAMSARGAALVGAFSSQELSQLAWAYAVLAQPPAALLDAVDRLVAGPDRNQYFASWSEQQLANLAWAYAVLAQVHRPAFARLWREIAGRESFAEREGCAGREGPSLGAGERGAGRPGDPTAADHPQGRSGPTGEAAPEKGGATAGDAPSAGPEGGPPSRERHLSQLYQVGLTLELEQGAPGLALGEGLRARAHAAWQQEVRGTKLRRASGLEREVAYHLATTGLGWVQEYAAAEYSLDFALPAGKVAVEVDGPSHFTRNTDEPLGSTVIKRRHLAAAQWTVISIPYYEWEELYGETEQAEYIQDLLKRWGATKVEGSMESGESAS